MNVNLSLVLNIKKHIWKIVNTEEIFSSSLCSSRECNLLICTSGSMLAFWDGKIKDTKSKGYFSNASIKNSMGSNLNVSS